MFAHLGQQRALSARQRIIECRFPAEPGRQHQTGLGPAKDPRNRPQAFYTTGTALGRTAAQRQATQFLLRSGLTKVLDELGVVTHHAAVGLDAVGGQFVHEHTPGRLRRWWRQQRRFQYRGQVQVEVLFSDVRQTELEADHLALFGGTETPGHRPRWL
ncbi:hypothetical protein D3C72_1827540 [compost metagenome]